MDLLATPRPPLIDIGGRSIDAEKTFNDAFGSEWPPVLVQAWKSLGKTRLDGTAQALEHLGQEDRGFLFADGTGTGKGSQMILIAALMAEKTGKPSLLATKNAELAGQLVEEAESMGVKMGPRHVVIAAFDELPGRMRDGAGHPVEYGLAAFDEAHAIPSLDLFKQIRAENRAYATATPFADLETRHAVYFLADLQGVSEEAMAGRLGLDGSSRSQARQSLKKVEEVCRELYDTGAMVRREYPFWGEMGVRETGLTPSQLRDQQRIVGYYDGKQADPLLSSSQREELGRKKEEELIRFASHTKVEAAVKAVRSAVESGRKVILYGSQESYESEALGVSHPSFLTELKRGLAAEEIDSVRLKAEPGREERNQEKLSRFVGKTDSIHGFIADAVAEGRRVVVEVGEGAKSAAFAEILAERLRKHGIGATLDGEKAEKQDVVISFGHRDIPAGGEKVEDRARTVLRVPYSESAKFEDGRVRIKTDDRKGKECDVLLMPDQYSEGFSNLIHAGVGDLPRVVMQTTLTNGSDPIQIAGRGSRANSISPTAYELLYAANARADQVGLMRTVDDLAVLKAAGSGWADRLASTFEPSLAKGLAAERREKSPLAEAAASMTRAGHIQTKSDRDLGREAALR